MFNFGFSLDSSSYLSFIIIIVLFVALYFFMIRPQRKQEKKDAAMRDALAVGDEVTTIGGIIGKVVSIKGETFVLETTKDKTKIRFLKGAIRSVDVKAADLAAQVIEANAAAEAPQEAVSAPEVKEDAPAKKKKGKKSADEEAPATDPNESVAENN